MRLWLLLLLAQFVTTGHYREIFAVPTISYVRGCVNSSTSPATSVTCAIAGGVTAGNLLVVSAKVENHSGTATPTVTTSSGVSLNLVPVVWPFDIGALTFNSTIWAAVIPSTGAETISVSWAGTTSAGFNDVTTGEYHTTAYGGWIAPRPDRSLLQRNDGGAASSCPTGTTLATNNSYDLVVAVSENFNVGETWGSLSGFTNEAASSRNTVGWYDKSVTATGTQTASIPFSGADTCVGMIAGFESAGGAQICTGCTIAQSTQSGASNAHNDPTSMTSQTTTGNVLVAFGVHTNYASGVTTIADSNPNNVWYPCDSPGTAGGGFHDVSIGSGLALSCNYSPGIQSMTNDTITINSSDCASSTCTALAGTYLEYSGPSVSSTIALDVIGSGSGTSTTGSNNANGATVVTTTAHDLVISSLFIQAGTITNGSTPVTWNLRSNSPTLVAVEDAVWSGIGSITPTWTMSASSSPYGGITIAVK
jgi:hypothetical protein